MKIGNLKRITVILLFLGLCINLVKAQYIKLYYNDKCPFDTAVAIQINTYRAESRKLSLADSILSNFDKQIVEYKILNTQKDSALMFLYRINLLSDKEIDQKNRTINDLSSTFDKIVELNKKQNTWFNRNKLAIGFVSGIIATTGILILLK